LTSLALTWFSAHRGEQKGVMSAPSAVTLPVTAPAVDQVPGSKGEAADSKVKEIPK
jgi:hypothetical protein